MISEFCLIKQKIFRIMKSILLLPLCFLLCMNITHAQTPQFSLKVSNIKSLATLRIAFYKKENSFPDQNKFEFGKEVKPSKTGEVLLTWNDIPVGEYALAIYQDSNGNKKLDTNLVGYPKEPFGFSQNIKPKFSAPNFAECKIVFNNQNNTFFIKLID
ncbi:Protein of unknown function DUF2141 [Emticicia oligotrophica DSM 17448]|uniref:DUF2141 domain-containing protein n=2 Tax=Emticicia TaxID=312278 RepID=A0ABM5N3F8_EMTOG|nr:Protein of unknown function DUF2141 [Emticicia oligotrophica DSM 17448]